MDPQCNAEPGAGRQMLAPEHQVAKHVELHDGQCVYLSSYSTIGYFHVALVLSHFAFT